MKLSSSIASMLDIMDSHTAHVMVITPLERSHTLGFHCSSRDFNLGGLITLQVFQCQKKPVYNEPEYDVNSNLKKNIIIHFLFRSSCESWWKLK